MKYKLYPPGTRKNSPCWTLRATVEGRPVEASCRTADREEAEQFAGRYLADLRAARDRLFPKRRMLGDLERWLLDNLMWAAGEIRWRDGRILRFCRGGHGYCSAQVLYGGYKRTVLEHRVVFLLVNGWLPESIDHKNRNRTDNAPANLEASTPFRQAQNRGAGLRSRSLPQMVHRIRHRSRRDLGEGRGKQKANTLQ